MSLKQLVAVGLFSVAAAIGCDESAPTTPATPAKPSAGATNDKAVDAAADLKMKAAGAQDKAAAAMGDAKTATADASNSMVAEAQKIYAQVNSAISGGKFDDAQKYFDQLKGMRDKLPADWQTKIDELGKMLTDAKAKMGSLPSMPAMPK